MDHLLLHPPYPAPGMGPFHLAWTQPGRGIFSLVNPEHYEAGLVLAEAGVISGFDMTVETALVKRMILLGTETDKGLVKEKMKVDLAGELTNYEINSPFTESVSDRSRKGSMHEIIF